MKIGTVPPVISSPILTDDTLGVARSPRRVYTVSHIDYVVDRLEWLYKHRNLIGGLKFIHEPPVLRFFTGKLQPIDNWGAKLAEAFVAEFGPNG